MNRAGPFTVILLAPLVAVLALGGCATVAGPPAPGTVFRDCQDCPDLIVVPAGRFPMGSPPTEPGRFEDEGPVHEVSIARPLAVMRAPVTVGQYARFAYATGLSPRGGCNVWNEQGDWHKVETRTWRDPGFPQRDDHPVVCVSWDEGQAFADWLSARTGQTYRFLSEAEFEYLTRAGTTFAYPWGADGENFCAYANGFDRTAARGHTDWGTPACDDGYAFTAPVDRFAPNGFGLHGMTGNAFQWVEDCFVPGGYAGAPADGTARQADPCKARAIRGGSWANGPRGLRAAMRDRDPPGSRYANISIRLVREIKAR
jgi:formylglycine-generating enzyme required for sulfatase activity